LDYVDCGCDIPSPSHALHPSKLRHYLKFDIDLISTSHVEKQNHTLRMHCRRLSRLTNAFSKKLENFKAAVALHYAYYNFVKVHQTIRCTPAMEAGVANSAWTVQDLVTMTGA
jgi:hypothetical protein